MTVHDHHADRTPRIRRPARRRVASLAAGATLLAAGVLVPTGAASAAGGSGAPDFGPNVFVYDPSTPVAEIQAKLDALA